jgi:hypothetical protein
MEENKQIEIKEETFKNFSKKKIVWLVVIINIINSSLVNGLNIFAALYSFVFMIIPSLAFVFFVIFIIKKINPNIFKDNVNSILLIIITTIASMFVFGWIFMVFSFLSLKNIMIVFGLWIIPPIFFIFLVWCIIRFFLKKNIKLKK